MCTCAAEHSLLQFLHRLHIIWVLILHMEPEKRRLLYIATVELVIPYLELSYLYMMLTIDITILLVKTFT